MFVTSAADISPASVSRKLDDPEEKFEFHVASGPISDVLAAFGSVTGIEVTAETAGILELRSDGVIGRYTADQALKLIFQGTGVSYSFTGPRKVSIAIRAEGAAVDIEAGNPLTISSPKFPHSLKETPQTIGIISNEVIERQGSTTLRDVLNNVPGITVAAGEGGTPAGDNLTIRGFSARNDIYVDGVRDLGAQSRDPFDLEQVEVVKGPSSTFTGRGSTGGTVNLVSKLPNLRRSFTATLVAGTDDAKRATVDVNLPISGTIGIRVNALAHDSDVPGRNVVSNRRWGFAPSVYFGMGRPTRLTASYFYLGQENISDYGIPWVPATNNVLIDHRDRPAPVPRSTFYGYTDRDREKLRSDLATLRFEHDLNDAISIRSQFRYGYSRRDSIATPPRFTNNDSTSINRELRSWITNENIWDDQTDLTVNFRTGRFEHSAVAGLSASLEKNSRVLRTGPNGLTTLLDPNPNDIYTGAILINPLTADLTAKTFAAYAMDTVRLGKMWRVSGGIRWDSFGVSGRNVSTAVTPNVYVPIDRTDRIISGRAAIIFTPVESGNIYVSFGTSANPSLEGLLYSPADASLAPEKTRSYEAGTKWEFFDKRLLLTGALFRVEKTDARTPSIVAGEPPTLEGDQRIYGIELGVTGSITRNWQIQSAYTLLDSEIVRSNTVPTLVNGALISEVGKRLINTPRDSFSLWTTYRWDRLFFGVGPRFTGKRYGNNINTRIVDAYWVADAMGSVRVNKNIELRINVNNIGNKYYIDRIGGGHVVPGSGRALLISSGFDF